MIKNKVYVSWDAVEWYVSFIVQRINAENISFSGVYGLPRGGLVFATMLSYRLNIPMLSAPADNCLIVDDICDSGESLCHYINNTSGTDRHNYTISTMYINSACTLSQHIKYHYDIKSDDTWVVFPWEE